MAEERRDLTLVLSEDVELSIGEIARACRVQPDWVLELVSEGIIEPASQDQNQWRFSGTTLRRVRTVRRLQGDLGVNLAGAALALELLDELEDLRRRVRVLEQR